MTIDLPKLRVITASLGKRYSGINASMLAVVPEQSKIEKIAAIGFHIPKEVSKIRFKSLFSLHDGQWRIWHARRNIDMMAGLILRYVFGFKFKLLFTSAAQRRHSWITRFYYKRMDAVIAVSQKGASFINRTDVKVIMHGVDTTRFRPIAQELGFGANLLERKKRRLEAWGRWGLPGKFGVGVFGRIRPSKGSEDFVDALLKVLPKRPEWMAVFIGQATTEFKLYEEKLKEKIRKAGLDGQVHFAGFVPNDEIPHWYQSLSLTVCPSRKEGFGLPCLESMASGTPVITTRAGAWPELVQESGEFKNGCLVDIEAPDQLSEALLSMTESTDEVEQLGLKARSFVAKNFKIENEAKGIQEVYEELLK